MARQITLVVALVAVVAVNVASAFGPYGLNTFEGLGNVAVAGAANIDSARATNHALAAENRATDALVDRATGNPIGAQINENRALGHTVASNVAAQRSTGEAILAGGMGGSMGAALGANAAASAATRTVGSALAAGPLSTMGYGPYGAGLGAYPGTYGAAYGYPAYGVYGPGFAGPMGFGQGMNRLGSGIAATGAALANGIAGPALASTAATLQGGLSAVPRLAALA